MNHFPPVRLAAILIGLFAGFLLVVPAFASGTVTVSPQEVLPGASVTVSGTGWAPNDQILVSFTDASGNVIPLGVILADTAGNFNKTIVVPTVVSPGTYVIDGNGRGGSVSVKLTVLAPSPTPSALAPATQTSAMTSTPVASQTVATQPSPTFTPTETPTLTPTATPTMTPTATPTMTPTATPTSTPTPTPTLPERIASFGGGGALGWLVFLLPLGLAAYFGWRQVNRRI